MRQFIIFGILFLFISCGNEDQKLGVETPLFVLKDTTIGISFENSLTYDEEFNPYLYRNFYNGGGVAIGDINNDGLEDIYFTGNMVDNKLYLNRGNWQFEDITARAGVACPDVWSTGASFVDINQDGYLDLYVCKSGKPQGNNRYNELFINNGPSKDSGQITFTESAKEYGLDIEGLSVHAAFFDYDKDGDLDAYILNNSLRSVGAFDLVKDQRNIPDESGNGNKFLRNDNGLFTEITQEAGVFSSKIGFGLGITLGDFNQDNWTDIFISNDFFERDYLYINNTQGGFTEELENYFQSISMGSMGADLADLDNDLLSELIVTEMLPENLERQKTKTLFESWDKYTMARNQGYFHQFARNTLQKNLGDRQFAETGRLAGISGSEWSWGALLFDMDNNGLRDIFISNGIYKDLLDRDYLAYQANEETVKSRIRKNEKNVITSLIDAMPSQAVPNAAYSNQGNLIFQKKSDEWGLGTPSFSNGSAYGDLDNDGDLDLVINNVNMPSFVYENTTDTLTHRSITLKLMDSTNRLPIIGAKATIKYGNNNYVSGENYVSRGFQSSVPHGVHLGMGNTKKVDSLWIQWPCGTVSKYTDLTSNKTYSFKQPICPNGSLPVRSFKKLSPTILGETIPLFDFEHEENNYVDFNNERLLPQMNSNEGPAFAMADVNKDGKLDFFVGGAKNQTGRLFISSPTGYQETDVPFVQDAGSEDTDALFFDGDNDGDLDLYVCHGGKAFSPYSVALNDAYYQNDQGTFAKSKTSLQFSKTFSSSTVAASDYDKDGDIDLFVGERYKTNLYGLPGTGHLLENNGDGTFKTLEEDGFVNLGMITNAQWGDLDNDGWEDLVVLGEWMPIKVFLNKEGILVDKTEAFGIEDSSGLWTALEIIDIDNDGDLDIIAGNIGQNSFFRPQMKMFVHDFDGNGFQEQIICQFLDGRYYPIADKDELISQIPDLKKKLLYYKDYAKADIFSIFPKEELKNVFSLDLQVVESMVFFNDNGKLNAKSLPHEAQYAPIYAINASDIDADGYVDLFLGGNQYLVKPQFGRYDASAGWAIFGPHKSNDINNRTIPLRIEGQIRSLNWVDEEDRKILTAMINDEKTKFYEFKRVP
ncbi:VCBS repeat-containing protein [Ulvibacterium sp.]|uniref:VCBS repeat-containing protein n=1 Tax=Ulvibacterium sp. TaxID=2665914 RepID=UPI0026262530|nr:VCBS repeat-containing protein [Ulvibacterium sp.]